MARKDNPLYQITEAEFQRQVTGRAVRTGWKWWHISDARKAARGRLVGDAKVAGLPDLLMVHPSRGFLLAELKRQDGKLRPAQEAAMEVMGQAAALTVMTQTRVRVHLWRPSDMDDVIIPALLGQGPTTYGF